MNLYKDVTTGKGPVLGTFRVDKKGKLEEEISLDSGQIVPCNIEVETPATSR